ncbi:DUF2057 domain-containing protein [Vibrio intestinalis]|uniref:DUF2057 domain-containing protein n=1 Tax=Vibrio intestinalis TaxID=2933291 RepID=UPI0021A8F8AF|nr:DUF2057 domain-containing protein [Vibrio intestinalis]
MRLFLLLVAAVSLPLSAKQVDTARYVNVLVANENLVQFDEVTLQQGDNQFVVEFDGRLKKKNKEESISVRPQIIVLSDIDPQTDKIEIELAAKTHKQLGKLEDDNLPLFNVYKNEQLIDTKQRELPAAPGIFPYKDPVALVKQYNKEQGLIFDSGNIRSLKEELETIQQQPGTLSTTAETEATLQLKIWYNRANDEERAAFKKWLSEQ